MPFRLIGLGCLAALAGCHVDTGMCANKVIQSVASPDGLLRMVEFERDCGATTGMSTHVSLIGRDVPLPGGGGNLWIADDNHGAALTNEGGELWTEILWTANDQLTISYAAGARVFKSASRLADVSVTYSERPASAPR